MSDDQFAIDTLVDRLQAGVNGVITTALVFACDQILKTQGPKPGTPPKGRDESDLSYRLRCIWAWSDSFTEAAANGAKLSQTGPDSFGPKGNSK